MLPILTEEKERLLIELNKNLKIIETPIIAQDVEAQYIDLDVQALEAWKKAYVIAKNIDYLNYLFVQRFFHSNEPIKFGFSLLLTSIVFIESFTFFTLEKAFLKDKAPHDAAAFIFMALVALQAYQAVRLIESSKRPNGLLFSLSVFNANRAIVATTFQNLLANNYKLQRPTGIYPDMLTPSMIKCFERNKHLSIGFPGDFSDEKWAIQKQIFWGKLNPYSLEDTQMLCERYRLYIAYEHFHSGKLVATFNELTDTFTHEYFQFIADSIMSQVLLLLSPELRNYTAEEKKRFYQLMGYCSRHEPDSREFQHASFCLQFPDSEAMPLAWGDDEHSIQKGYELTHLTQAERQDIVKMLVDIFTPEKAYPKKITEKKHPYFFPWIKVQPEVSYNADEESPLLNEMKIA